MSEKDRKLPPLEPSSSLSSSGLPSTDRSLERLLGAIDKTIRASTTVVQMVYEEIVEQGRLSTSRHSLTNDAISKMHLAQVKRHDTAISLLGKMRLELATLTDQISTLAQSHSIQLGATNESKAALDRTREKLEAAAQDITGAHELMQDEEGHAPKWSHRALNFAWPLAVRTGKGAIVWGLKLLASSAAVGGIAKIIHDAIVGG